MRRTTVIAVALGLSLAAAGLAGCGGGGSGGDDQGQGAAGAGAAPPSTDMANRPSSTAKLTIKTPRNGQVVASAPGKLALGLAGAKIVPQTTSRIRPDQGHVHVTLDGQLLGMNYALEGPLPKLPAGTHVLQVEFVAADHIPFDPRVLTQAAFEVRR